MNFSFCFRSLHAVYTLNWCMFDIMPKSWWAIVILQKCVWLCSDKNWFCRIDSIKLNLKSKASISCFKLESIPEAKSILLESNQTCQNQFHTSRINFDSSKSGTNYQTYIELWQSAKARWLTVISAVSLWYQTGSIETCLEGGEWSLMYDEGSYGITNTLMKVMLSLPWYTG